MYKGSILGSAVIWITTSELVSENFIGIIISSYEPLILAALQNSFGLELMLMSS